MKKYDCYSRIKQSNYCTFYKDVCGPINKMACGHGIWGIIPWIAVMIACCLLIILISYTVISQVDAHAQEWGERPGFVVGNLAEYHDAKRRATIIGGCYGWSEEHQKYMAWGKESKICRN